MQPPEVFCKKGAVKYLTKFMRPAALLKKRPWHRCFPVNFVKFLRTPLVAASATKNIRKSLVF